MKSTLIKLLFYTILLTFASFSGCKNGNYDESASVVPPTQTTPVQVSISTPEITPSLTASPLPTATQTQTPSLTPTITSTPTNTFSPTKTPTWTAVPTLEPNEAMVTLEKIYQSNGDCESFPCWWGIVPGETSWENARNILAPLGQIVFIDKSRGGTILYESQFTVPADIDPLGSMSARIWIKDGDVRAIAIGGRRHDANFDYSLSGILTRFGVPQEIWVDLHPQSMTEKPFYYLQLFYPDQGVKFLSQPGSANVNNDLITICPQEFSTKTQVAFSLLIWHPGLDITFKNINVTLLDRLSSWDHEDYVSLVTVTDNFSTSDFYDHYTDPETTFCINIPLSKLP